MWDGCKILLGEKRTLKEMPQSSGKDPEDANTISQLPIVERLNVKPFLVTPILRHAVSNAKPSILGSNDQHSLDTPIRSLPVPFFDKLGKF